MRHGRDRDDPPAPARPAAGRPTARHAKGRHAAGRTRRAPLLASLAPRSWPLSLGVGLAVTVATTTSFTVTDPDLADPLGAEDAGTTTTAAGAGSGAAVAAAGATLDRGDAASRSGERSAPATGRGTTGIVVPRDVTMSGTGSSGDAAPTAEIEAAPPVLPGCDGVASGAGSNGYLPESELCELWDGYPPIRADAAVALARLNEAYIATFGEPICLTDGYRSYDQQVAAKAAKGYLAATPGTSNHGWGLAVDICADSYAGDRWDWLAANAPAYGWDNPEWARTSKYEPWHWEFTAAVAAQNGY